MALNFRVERFLCAPNRIPDETARRHTSIFGATIVVPDAIPIRDTSNAKISYMSPTLHSKLHLAGLLSLFLSASFAQAADTYSFRVSSPGVIATTLPTPPANPEPPRNYAKLLPGTASFVISPDGLTATHQGYKGNGDILANVGLSSGKWYWEVQRNAGLGYVAVGIGPSWASSPGWGGWGNAGQSTAFGIAYLNQVGFGATGPDIKRLAMPSSAGDVLGFALDMDSGILRVFNNCIEYGVWSGWTGERYPVVGSGGGAAGGVVTANFGASPFTCPVPVGYNAGVWAP